MPNTVSTGASAADREAIAEGPNPLGLEGVEFIEYATSKPQALGQVLEKMGFRPVHAIVRARCSCAARAASTSSSTRTAAAPR